MKNEKIPDFDFQKKKRENFFGVQNFQKYFFWSRNFFSKIFIFHFSQKYFLEKLFFIFQTIFQFKKKVLFLSFFFSL